jgi:hypothetical protein
VIVDGLSRFTKKIRPRKSIYTNDSTHGKTHETAGNVPNFTRQFQGGVLLLLLQQFSPHDLAGITIVMFRRVSAGDLCFSNIYLG